MMGEGEREGGKGRLQKKALGRTPAYLKGNILKGELEEKKGGKKDRTEGDLGREERKLIPLKKGKKKRKNHRRGISGVGTQQASKQRGR